MGAGRQNRGAGNAEMGKQQLSELLKGHLPFLIFHTDGHIAQAQSHHGPALVGFGHLQRHQGAARLHNGMAHCGGHVVTVAGGAGQRIGAAAGTENDAAGFIRSLVGDYTGHRAVRRLQRLDVGRHHPDAGTLQVCPQGVDDRRGLVAFGKYPVAPLHLETAPQSLKKGHDLLRREGFHGAVEKAAVTGDVLQNLLGRAAVGDVAAALAGDVQFFAQAVVVLQKHHPGPQFRRRTGGHHPGGPGAYHQDISVPFVHRLRTLPKSVPAPHRSGTGRFHSCGPPIQSGR